MDIVHLLRPKSSPSLDELIARAARSWNPEYPGRMELPRRYANMCSATIVLAESRQRDPQEVLSEVCRIKGINESEVVEALKAMALRIDEQEYPFQRNHGIQAAMASKTRDLLARLR